MFASAFPQSSMSDWTYIIWGNAIKKSPDLLFPTNCKCKQDTHDSSPTPIYITIPISSMNLHKRINCHCKKDCTVHCKWGMHIQTCMVLFNCKGVNASKFCIVRMIYKIFSLTKNISTLCVIFMIKTHSKSKTDTRNKFSDLKLARKHVS